jgi:hypothetical protein
MQLTHRNKKEQKLIADTICFTLHNPNRAHLIMEGLRYNLVKQERKKDNVPCDKDTCQEV